MSGSNIQIEYASTDDHIILIHRFLLVVAGPMLPGPIDAKQSIEEVWRVVTDDVALMAIKDDHLVGTIGLFRPKAWWGNVFYLANRWAFVLPGSKAWRPLLKEARAIARSSEMECHIVSEERGTLTILNKSKLRGDHPSLANSPNSSRALLQ